MTNPSAYAKAKKIYQELREMTYRDTENTLTDICELHGQNISLQPINTPCLTRADAWHTNRPERLNWTKESIKKYIRMPRRFELAIFCNGDMCGLAIGKVPKGKSHVRIDKVSSKPTGNPLRGYIMPIVLDCAKRYADYLDINTLIIMEPINSRVRQHYMSGIHGFKFKEPQKEFRIMKNDYLYLDLKKINTLTLIR